MIGLGVGGKVGCGFDVGFRGGWCEMIVGDGVLSGGLLLELYNIIFQGVLTIKFPHLSKFIDLVKNLKFEHQSIFPMWGRVKLNFMDRYGKPNIFSENSSRCEVFPPNCQKMTLWHKKENHYPPRWICITHIWSPTLFPRGIIIFQGVLTKFDEISTSGKINRCNEGPKI